LFYKVFSPNTKIVKMKNVLTIVFISAFLLINAQRQEVMPQVPFDENLTKDMLAYGNSTIEGIAIAREYTNANRWNNLLGVNAFGIKHIAPEGTVVVLFPVTSYFEEYYRLRSKYKKSKKYMAVLSQQAFKYRIETKTDKNGRFVFEKMKPGKYYIETVFGYVGKGVGSQQVGRTDYYNGFGNYTGSSPVYQSYYYNYNETKVESKFVEIRRDGELKEIRL
jgi:hypothetical protein